MLKPLQDPGLKEHQRVLLEIRTDSRDNSSSALEAWHRVYAGLSEEEVAEVEAMALARDRFLHKES
jgi:hypothetical protein